MKKTETRISVSKKLIAGCKTSVIPDDGSVTVVGTHAFFNAETLTTLKIPDTVQTLESNCFDCSGLTDIEIPYGITKIQAYCIYHCGRLLSVRLPKTVTTIEEYGIYFCARLKEVHVPSSVANIGEHVFSKATIYGAAGSYAETYAASFGFRFVAE